MGKGADREVPSPSEAVFVGAEVKTGPAVDVHGMCTSGAQSLLGDPQVATADELRSLASLLPGVSVPTGPQDASRSAFLVLLSCSGHHLAHLILPWRPLAWHTRFSQAWAEVGEEWPRGTDAAIAELINLE